MKQGHFLLPRDNRDNVLGIFKDIPPFQIIATIAHPVCTLVCNFH